MPGKLEGTVVAVSPGGDLVTDLDSSQLSQIPDPSTATVSCEEHQTSSILQEGHSEAEMTLVAVVAQSGKLEIRLVGESAQAFLGIPVGAKVVVKW